MTANRPSPADRLRLSLAELRWQLAQTDAQTIARLLEHVRQLGLEPTPPDDPDLEQLPVMLSEAVRGVDLEQDYPLFFERLLRKPRLRQRFLDLLHALEQVLGQHQASATPRPPSTSLSPLLTVPPKATVELWKDDTWRVTWWQSPGQLNYALTLAEAVPASQPWPLFHSRVDLTNGLILDATLQATLNPGPPRHLLCLLAASLSDETGQPPSPLPALSTTLICGPHSHTLPLRPGQPTPFPPIPLADVAGPAPLRLSLHTSLPA